MINGSELLQKFLKSSIENPIDEAHINELVAVFLGVLHFYKCLQGHPTPYHDITKFIYNYGYEIRIDDLEILMDAIELKLGEKSDDFSSCFRKFRRHILLAVTQKYYIQKAATDALDIAREAEEIANKAANISNKANESINHARKSAKKAEDIADYTKKIADDANEQIKEVRKSSDSMMVNYITILGIFASIIITIFGGMQIISATTGLLQSNINIATLILVLSFLTFLIILILWMLFTFISNLKSGNKRNYALVMSLFILVLIMGLSGGYMFYLKKHKLPGENAQILIKDKSK